MLKKLMITTAASALVATAAWAQSPNQSQSGSSSPPAATQSQSGSDGMNQGASAIQGASKNFISMQKPDQWLASKFRGTDVVGSDNEKIGDVSDILFDKNGKIEAYVISVGGFLGMGSKDVALPPSAFQVVSGDTGSTTGAGGSGGTSARNADPNNIKLKLAATKDELKNAQAFEPYKAQTTGSTNSGGTSRPGGSMGGTGGANR